MAVTNLARWTSGLFIPRRRSIGGIHAQVTISEEERDELQITEHPVEQGAPISDHAFKRPSEVRIKAGWSRGDLSATGSSGMYGILLAWQAALNPFDVYTGKRTYHNMLIQSLTVTTDSHSEFVLMADLVLRQVIIVAVSTSKVSSLTSTNPTNQSSPESNASTTEKGDQQPRPVSAETVQKAEAGDVSEYQYNVGTPADPGDNTAEFQYGEGQTPEAEKVNDTAARNTEAQQNVEKNISLDRGERQQGQGTKDILADRDKALPQMVRAREPRNNIVSLRAGKPKTMQQLLSMRA